MMGETETSGYDDKLRSDSKLIRRENIGCVYPFLTYFEESVFFTASKLSALVANLELHEKVSLVFLLYDDPDHALFHLERMLGGSSNDSISSWYDSRKADSRSQFMILESLTLIQNFQALSKLNFNKYDALKLVNANSVDSFFTINPVKKILFKIAEVLTIDQTRELVNYLERDIHLLSIINWPYPIIPSYIEIYFLFMISKKYIDVNNRSSLNKIVLYLKQIKLDFGSLIESKFVKKSCATNTETYKEHSFPNVPSNKDKAPRQKDAKNCYEIIDNKRVGVCIIINQQKFKGEKNLQLSDRVGSDVDRDKLVETFKNINFEVHSFENLDHSDICPAVVNGVKDLFVKDIHSIFVLIILSHGIEGAVYGANGIPVPIDLVRDSLNDDLCPSLSGKPKVLIVQACQGRSYYEKPNLSFDSIQTDDIARRVSDILICLATVPGFKAFRHKVNGSWYIQALCKQLKELPDEDLNTIVTSVNEELKDYVVAICGRTVSMLSQFTSCLSRKLYFKLS